MKFRKFIEIFFLIAACLTLLGTLLRCTIRDAYPICATLFYMTPLALLVFGAILLLARQVYLRNIKFTRFWTGMLVVLFVWWIRVDWKSHFQPAKTEDEIVVLLANLARGHDVEALAKKVREIDPDIIGFIEALALTAAQREKWSRTFPKYEWSMVDGGTQLFAKGEISSPWMRPLPDRTRLGRSIIKIDGTEIHCFTVDIASTIHRPRKPALDGLVQFLKKSEGENVLIMGDFNTPGDSVHFAELRKDFENLFEKVGSGYAPTWPYPLPVLTIDQIWIGKSIEPIACRLVSNPHSDHRMVVGRIRILGAEPN